MERTRNTLMDQMAGAKAPSAGLAGRGIGNIPYARGMQTGSFGQARPAPTEPPPAEAQPYSPPAPVPPGSGGPSPPATTAPPAGVQSPFLSPLFYFEVMGSIMTALVSAAESDQGYY